LINLLEVIFKQEKNINSLKKEITSIPSKLFNIKVINKEKFIEDSQNIKVTKDLKKMLNEEGRILLRPSGTENLVRLLIEHRNPKQIEILSEYFYDNINKNTIV
jgi:phosphoglucosamine mutase